MNSYENDVSTINRRQSHHTRCVFRPSYDFVCCIALLCFLYDASKTLDIGLVWLESCYIYAITRLSVMQAQDTVSRIEGRKALLYSIVEKGSVSNAVVWW